MSFMDLLPEDYKNSAQVIELQGAFEHWAAVLQAAKEDLFLQMNVETATWGLTIWETALGLQTDVSKPYEYRRTRIMSKLRGAGTTTVAMMQNVAESFSNGEVAIIEYNSENRFEVKFIGTIGIPPNMEDLTAAIEEIKPAHLEYTFEYTYRTYGDLSAYTHATLSTYTHQQLREGVIS